MPQSQEPNTAFLNQIGEFSRRLANDGAVPPPPSPFTPVPPSPSSLSPDTAAFARRIRSVLVDQGTASAGALYLINLDTVRQTLEAQGRWERLADRVNHICRRIIEQHLDTTDLFHYLPGPLFMIVFTHLRPDAAKAKCAIIAEEIGRTSHRP